MHAIFARTRARIYPASNGWTLAPKAGAATQSVECEVELEIQGDDAAGYHLVMSPAGFLEADTWHRSRAEALLTAHELFGVVEAQWSKK